MSTTTDWVVLNVGGDRFHTTRSTLTRLPGTLLATMFETGSAFTLARDEKGAVLIDRDGRYFRVLLNYLRHGSLVIDPGLSPLGVYEEARFFGLHELAAELDPTPPVCHVRLRRVATWNGQQDAASTAKRGVKTLLALPDGSLLSGGADGRVLVWHPHASGDMSWQMTAVCELSGHRGEVSAIAFVEATGRIFTASHDHTVKAWAAPPSCGGDGGSFKRGGGGFNPLAGSPPSPRASSRPGSAASSTPSSPYSGRSRSNSLTAVSKLATRSCLASLRAHAAEVTCLVTHNGWIVSGSHDRSLCFWSWCANDGQPPARMLQHAHQSAVLALCHVHSLLVSSAADGSVGCWDIETGCRLATLSTHAPAVLSLTPLTASLDKDAADGAADGLAAAQLCAGDGSGLLKLWRLEHGSAAMPAHGGSGVTTGGGSADAAAAGVTGVVARVSAALHAPPAEASASDDEREVSLLEFLAEEPLAESAAGVVAVQGLALAPQQRLVAAAGAAISVWHLPSAAADAPAHCRLSGFRYSVTALAATEAGVYAGTAEGEIHALAWSPPAAAPGATARMHHAAELPSSPHAAGHARDISPRSPRGSQ